MTSEAQEQQQPVHRSKEKKRDTREIEFSLSPDEMVTKAKEAADLRLVSASLEAEFSRVKSTYKGRLEEKKNQISALLDVIREGKEKRIVEVTDVLDYEHAVVETFFGEQLMGHRVMTAEERQLGLFPGVEKKSKKQGQQTELPLDGDAPPPAEADDDMADLPPIVLRDPTHKGQEEHITNPSHRKNQAVEFHGTSWLLEPAEMAIFHVVEEEVFGKQVLVWAMQSSQKIRSASDPAPAQQESSEPQA